MIKIVFTILVCSFLFGFYVMYSYVNAPQIPVKNQSMTNNNWGYSNDQCLFYWKFPNGSLLEDSWCYF